MPILKQSLRLVKVLFFNVGRTKKGVKRSRRSMHAFMFLIQVYQLKNSWSLNFAKKHRNFLDEALKTLFQNPIFHSASGPNRNCCWTLPTQTNARAFATAADAQGLAWCRALRVLDMRRCCAVLWQSRRVTSRRARRDAQNFSPLCCLRTTRQ